TISLSVSSGLNENMISTKFRSLIESCLESTTGKHYTLSVSVTKENESLSTVASDFETHTELNPKYNFENFVVGGNNNIAYAASLAVAEAPSQQYNPLFLYGGSGLGKTHLLQAIGNYYAAAYPKKKVLYTTSEKFTYELVNSIREKTNQEFRNKYRTLDLLLIDDIQFLATKELTQEEFFHTFNALHDAGKQIVITSDRMPSETPHLTDRLKTRFQSGLLADVQPPDYETRIAILRNKIENEYFTFDEEIVDYVAFNIKSNVRDLEGAVKRILAYAGIERTNTISLDLAQKALKEILTVLPQRNITTAVIIDEVEKYYHLPHGSIVTKKRSSDIAYPRHIAMYIAYEVLDVSYSKLGDEFNRDHSSVMSAIKKIKAKLSDNSELSEIITELVQNIKKN
ncbi:MAG: chromosomal replication initiator protein DnaA, partial [Oscillospiraceae bacterium]